MANLGPPPCVARYWFDLVSLYVFFFAAKHVLIVLFYHASAHRYFFQGSRYGIGARLLAFRNSSNSNDPLPSFDHPVLTAADVLGDVAPDESTAHSATHDPVSTEADDEAPPSSQSRTRLTAEQVLHQAAPTQKGYNDH